MWKQLLNILFPVKCVGCGRSQDNTLLCPSCGQFLPYNNKDALPLDHKHFVLFTYDDRAKKIIAQIKYHKNRELIPFIQKILLKNAPKIEADLIIPVPLNPLRYQERSFNQAEEFFKLYAEYHNIPLCSDIVYRAKNSQKLAGLSPDERQKEIVDIFEIWAEKQKLLENKRILIVDDIITTGSTVKNLAYTIQKHHPASIEILGVFRP